MWESNSALFLEIIGGLLLALYLLRRVTLTTIYCTILVKAVFRAARRKYRRIKIYWRHFRDHKPHGFCARFAENIFFFVIPSFIRRGITNMIRFFIHQFRRAESWAICIFAPWAYRKLPNTGQGFCNWIIAKVDAFQKNRASQRRYYYAKLSYSRWEKRQSNGQNTGVCPMRHLLPRANTAYQRTGQAE